MKLNQVKTGRPRAAFTIVEIIMSVVVLAIMMISLFGGFSAGFAVVQLARENLRATQILVQKTEDVRLYSWSQVTNSTYFKTTFQDWYNPSGTNTHSAGAVYQGLGQCRRSYKHPRRLREQYEGRHNDSLLDQLRSWGAPTRSCGAVR